MLGMAFFKSLVKQHGTKFFEPIGKALAAAGIKKPNPLNPAHAWALQRRRGPYAKWLVARKAQPQAPRPELPADMPEPTCRARRVRRQSPASIRRSTIDGDDAQASAGPGRPPMPHGRSCRQQIQDAVTILCTSLYAARSERRSRSRRRRRALPGPDPQTHRPPPRPIATSARVTKLGADDRRRRFQVASPASTPDEILMPY